MVVESRVSTSPKEIEAGVGAMPRSRICPEDGHALAVGEPIVKQVRTRSDRDACTTCA